MGQEATGRPQAPDNGSSRGRHGRWMDESGKSSIRGIIALILVVVTVYGGMKLIPVRAAAFQFDDAVTDEVTFASARRSDNDDIKKALLGRARELRLPVRDQDIRINRYNRYLVVEVEYTVDVQFIGGFVFHWTFRPRAEGPLI